MLKAHMLHQSLGWPRCHLILLVSEPFQEVLFEELVDETAFFGVDTFDDLARQIAKDDAIAADPQTMVAE
jgi:hypothetical protein